MEEGRRESAGRQRGDYAGRASLGFDRRVLVAYPEERVGFSVRINGPTGHVVGVEVRGIAPTVAMVVAAPSRAVAPYTADVSQVVSERAQPGLYPFSVVVHDHTKNQLIGAEKLGLLVLPRKLTITDYARLRRIYREGLGAQGVLWYLVAKVYRDGASFTELKKAYELIRGAPVRKATIANILKRMTRKGLIKKDGDGRYHPPGNEARSSLQQNRQKKSQDITA